ncbi:unnamed protein product [Cunninghamella blakesleeana]
MRIPRAVETNILLSKFKLNMDKNCRRQPLENELTAVQAVADYLKELHNYVLDEIQKRSFYKFEHKDIRYCLTVPAIWDDVIKHSMRYAAKLAGLIHENDSFDKLLLISEPEAAALYCEKILSEMKLCTNDRLMVCDAGGGTVDITSFEVVRPSRIKEITKGIGENCGSTFLDERFMDLLKEKLGDQIYYLNHIAINNMMDQFIEKIKPGFHHSGDHFISLPASVDLDQINGILDGNVMLINNDELKRKVFDPVVDRVLSLIGQQINEIPDGRLSYIILVGGFGTSKYLHQRVEQEFKRNDRLVLTPNSAEMAIVHGAVYYGLDPKSITARITKRAYGINAGMIFEPNIDPISTRLVRPDGTVRCLTRFLQFVKKNECINSQEYISKEMNTYYGRKNVYILVYATERDETPRYYNEPGISKLKTMVAPIPILPNATLGQVIKYNVRFYFGQTELKVEVDFGTGDTPCEANYTFDENELNTIEMDTSL